MTDQTSRDSTNTADMMATWMKTATDFWGAMAKAWPTADAGFDKAAGAESSGRFQQMLASHMKLWDSASKAMSEPGAMEAMVKGFQTAPEVSMRVFQTSIDSVVELQKRWTERLQKVGDTTEPFDFSDLDSDFLNRWTDTYKKELQQFLHIPQLGLTKFYQEKFNRAVDKYNLFQAAQLEFLQLLSVPVEKSFRVMQDKLAKIAEEGDLPEDSKFYYQMWIRILEGHFMTLFQSREYTEAMGKTLDAMNQFLSAREDVIEDTLQSFPIVTYKDMDELYKEIYQLKRRIRELERSKD